MSFEEPAIRMNYLHTDTVLATLKRSLSIKYILLQKKESRLIDDKRRVQSFLYSYSSLEVH